MLPEDGASQSAGQQVAGAGAADRSEHSSVAIESIRREAEENSLITAKLGIATSLFYALRSKHPPTASHCLRVALSCSSWIEALQLAPEESARIEIAALMHDLGKLGIPDRILRKPGKLSPEERATVSLVPMLGCDILRGCSQDRQLLETIRHATDWYNGTDGQKLVRDQLPLGARIIAIADAFDSMTSDQVYRPAMSREAAVGNLFAGSGVQFDPELTRVFVSEIEKSPVWPPEASKLTWLQGLGATAAEISWGHPAKVALPSAEESVAQVARSLTPGVDWADNSVIEPLLGTLTEAVVYVDTEGVIRQWNEAASRLTGIASTAVRHQEWRPAMISLIRSDGDQPAAECPVEVTLRTRTGVTGQFNICRQDGTTLPIELRSVLVTSQPYGTRGVLLIMQDLSAQFRLENNVRKLQRQVSQDTLTGVANRAEMDRLLNELINENHQPFSLIICDIDHFKSVNDIHGHQAGDEALVRVAQILASRAQATDLVCRYGGEEFVVICPECDLVAATRSAEAVRQSIEATELAMLDHSHITASFGVTQVQPGDTAESVFARADRALLQAKDTGRNQVIQLGVGGQFQPYTMDMKRQGWFARLLTRANGKKPLHATITTPVPFELAVSKLRGFLADHRAEIVTVAEGQMTIRLNVAQKNTDRRAFRSMLTFLIDLKIHETRAEVKLAGGERTTTQQRTTVQVTISPENGSRRSSDVAAAAQHVIIGLNCYLIGRIEQDVAEENGSGPLPISDV